MIKKNFDEQHLWLDECQSSMVVQELLIRLETGSVEFGFSSSAR
jgi:hypothetical protein